MNDFDNGRIRLMQGDCLERMKEIPDQSVDLILTDPPYGTTACKWDSVIPFDDMWQQLKRIIKPNGAVVLFGGEPFSSLLRCSNLSCYRYDWVWNKKKAANFLFANKQPLKKTENIIVFYSKQPHYDPQKTKNPGGRIYHEKSGIGNTIIDHLPNAPKTSKPGTSRNFDELLPDNILNFSKPAKPIHPTQKPVDLLEYLIRTYTKEDEVVLDFTFGSCSTGIAAVNTNRKFIGVELDEVYYQLGLARVKKHLEGLAGRML
jgi:DNA modification methylase